jgi:hypothetical protein
VPEGIERLIFAALATLVPPGGHPIAVRLAEPRDNRARTGGPRAAGGDPLGATLRARPG